MACIDGSLHYLDKDTGKRRWSFDSGRGMLELKTAEGYEGYSFIPSTDGKLYIHDPLEGVKMLPISIQDLVNDSPFISEDGIIYIGKKKANMYALNLNSGSIMGLFPSSGISSPAKKKTLIIGRSDYTIKAINPKSGIEMWNLTFSEYNSKKFYEEFEDNLDDSHSNRFFVDDDDLDDDHKTQRVCCSFNFLY